MERVLLDGHFKTVLNVSQHSSHDVYWENAQKNLVPVQKEIKYILLDILRHIGTTLLRLLILMIIQINYKM